MYTGHPSTLHTEKSVVDFCYAIYENRWMKICKVVPQFGALCTRLQMIYNSNSMELSTTREIPSCLDTR
jgi:hypothetical protein